MLDGYDQSSLVGDDGTRRTCVERSAKSFAACGPSPQAWRMGRPWDVYRPLLPKQCTSGRLSFARVLEIAACGQLAFQSGDASSMVDLISANADVPTKPGKLHLDPFFNAQFTSTQYRLGDLPHLGPRNNDDLLRILPSFGFDH